VSELIEELKYWRCDRPSEYKMDEFIRSVERLEKECDKYKAALDSIKEITLNNHDHDTLRINKICQEALIK